MNRETLEADFRSCGTTDARDRGVLRWTNYVHRLQLLEKDLARLSFAILSDFLSLVERATCSGTVSDPTGSIEQMFILLTSSSDKSASSRKGNERHIVHRDELDKWIGMLKWELEQLPNMQYYLRDGKLCSGSCSWRRQGSPTGGALLLTQTLPNGRRGRIVCAYQSCLCDP